MAFRIFQLHLCGGRRPRRKGLRPPTLSYTAVFLVIAMALAAYDAGAAGDTLESAQEAIAAGDYRLALDRLEPLIRAEPDNAEARFLRGVVFAQMGETDRAIAIFSNLTEQYPELSEPYNNLAVLYAAKGSLEKAREALLSATELQPDYHTAFENLGDVYTKLAAQAYERAYHLQGNNQRARNKYDVLAGLLGQPNPQAGREPGTLAPAPAPREVEAIPPETATTAPGDGEVCLAMGPMDMETQNHVATWLSEQNTDFQPYSVEARQPRAFQVYLDGGSTPLALRDELRDRGVKDIAVVTSGDLQGKLSLGVYRQEDSVERRLEQFEAMGYDAKTVTLYDVQHRHWLVVMQKNFDPLAFGKVFGHQKPRRVACDWRPTEEG